jgi:hypothetical protein
MSRNQVYTFEFDQPTYVGFKYRQGKPYQSPYGDGFTYALTNGCVAFFPPSVDKEIQALNLGPRESCVITRRKDGGEIAWEVERAAIQPNDGTLKVENLAGGSSGETDLNLNRPVTGVDPLIGDTSSKHHCAQHNTPLNGSAPQNHNGSAPPMSSAWGMPILRQALFAVIDDASEAEKYAAGKGLSIRFSGEDIRCMANTAVINAAQGRS